mmetsp:Transcript_13347/g.28797  ORF Transcript_13347/g.28797 Transcript_13347/m.28797 type:complete len:365 (+) Transcript_13347:36-1130(+)
MATSDRWPAGPCGTWLAERRGSVSNPQTGIGLGQVHFSGDFNTHLLGQPVQRFRVVGHLDCVNHIHQFGFLFPTLLQSLDSLLLHLLLGLSESTNPCFSLVPLRLLHLVLPLLSPSVPLHVLLHQLVVDHALSHNLLHHSTHLLILQSMGVLLHFGGIVVGHCLVPLFKFLPCPGKILGVPDHFMLVPLLKLRFLPQDLLSPLSLSPSQLLLLLLPGLLTLPLFLLLLLLARHFALFKLLLLATGHILLLAPELFLAVLEALVLLHLLVKLIQRVELALLCVQLLLLLHHLYPLVELFCLSLGVRCQLGLALRYCFQLFCCLLLGLLRLALPRLLRLPLQLLLLIQFGLELAVFRLGLSLPLLL